MFGVTREEVECIVDRKLSSLESKPTCIPKPPEPAPIYLYYPVVEVSNSNQTVIVWAQPKGKEIWREPYCNVTWNKLREGFYKSSDAYDWILKHSKTIEKDFPLGISVKIYSLSKRLAKEEEK